MPSSYSGELVLDDSYKSYLWQLILSSVAQTTPPVVTMLQTPEPRPPVPVDGDEYVHPYTFAPVEDNGLRGSCVDWNKREDVTSIILQGQLSLEQVQDR